MNSKILVIVSIILSACNKPVPKIATDQNTDEMANKNLQEVPIDTTSQMLFTNYAPPIDRVVRTMFQDREGTFWFGTEGGAFKLVGNNLVYLEHIKSSYGKPVTIKAITEHMDGSIWMAHTDGISRIHKNEVTNYYESDGLISEDVWSIATDTKGQVWIGTIEGLCVFDGHNFKPFELPEGIIDTTRGISSTKMVHNIQRDSKGSLWFSTNAGLFSYANNRLTHVSKNMGISTTFVNEILEDSPDQLWVSTKAGLYQIAKNKAKNITAAELETGKGIGSINKAKDGTIWFVSNQHFLYTYNPKTHKLSSQSQTDKKLVVFQIYRDQQDRLWFVGFGGAYRLEQGILTPISKQGPW
jgi:ligand-binding sensor domain-containing protein